MALKFVKNCRIDAIWRFKLKNFKEILLIHPLEISGWGRYAYLAIDIKK